MSWYILSKITIAVLLWFNISARFLWNWSFSKQVSAEVFKKPPQRCETLCELIAHHFLHDNPAWHRNYSRFNQDSKTHANTFHVMFIYHNQHWENATVSRDCSCVNRHTDLALLLFTKQSTCCRNIWAQTRFKKCHLVIYVNVNKPLLISAICCLCPVLWHRSLGFTFTQGSETVHTLFHSVTITSFLAAHSRPTLPPLS